MIRFFIYWYLYTSVFFPLWDKFQLRFCIIILAAKRLHNAYISISSVVTLSKYPQTEGPLSPLQNGHLDTRPDRAPTIKHRLFYVLCDNLFIAPGTKVHTLLMMSGLFSLLLSDNFCFWLHFWVSCLVESRCAMHIHKIIYVYMHNNW